MPIISETDDPIPLITVSIFSNSDDVVIQELSCLLSHPAKIKRPSE